MTLKPGDIAVRGVRQRAPTNVVVGRASAGFGPVEFITLAQLGNNLVASGVVAPPGGGGTPGTNVLQAENKDNLQTESGAFITI